MPRSPQSPQSDHPVTEIPSRDEVAAERNRIRTSQKRRHIALVCVCVAVLAAVAIVLAVWAVSCRPSGADTAEHPETSEVVDGTVTDEADAAVESEVNGSVEDLSEANADEAKDVETSEAEPEGAGEIGVVNVETYLHQRAGASLDDEVIGHLLPGTQVQVIEEEDGWYKVVVPETVGYVCGDYLDVHSSDGTDDAEKK